MAIDKQPVMVSVIRLLTGLWRQRYIIIIPTLLLPLLSTYVSIKTEQKWSTYTTILIQESAKMNPFLEDLSVSTNLDKRIKTLATLLHSRHMLLSVGYELGMIRAEDESYKQENFVREMSAALSVQLIGEDLVKIAYNSDTPDSIDSILSVVSKRFLERVLAPELATLKASEVFLKEQLDERRDNLRTAEQKLAVFKENNANALPDLQGSNAQRLSDLKKLLESQQIKLSGAVAAKFSIRTRLAQVDPVMNQLEQEISAVKAELAIFKTRYTDKHSKVRTAVRKLNRLEEERAKRSKLNLALDNDGLNKLWELASTLSMDGIEKNELLISQLKEMQLAEGRVQQIQQEILSITNQIVALEKTLDNYGDVERNLLDLERDLNVKRMLYDDLLERFEKASVTGALGRYEQPERIKIIDKPYVPSSSDNLPIVVYLLAGLIAGLGLGLGTALIIEGLDGRLRYQADIELITGLPMVSRIPNIKISENLS